MKRNLCLISMVIIFLLFLNTNAQSHQSHSMDSLAIHDITLQAISWKAFDVYCSEGDTLSGFFQLTCDGDLFYGDQTKYDNWLLGGINFLIIDEANFDSWSQGLPINAGYERNGITELTWIYDVPSTGKWYIVYFNDSIYIKQIEGSITHASPSNPTVLLILLLLATSMVLVGLYLAKKKK